MCTCVVYTPHEYVAGGFVIYMHAQYTSYDLPFSFFGTTEDRIYRVVEKNSSVVVAMAASVIARGQSLKLPDTAI